MWAACVVFACLLFTAAEGRGLSYHQAPRGRPHSAYLQHYSKQPHHLGATNNDRHWYNYHDQRQEEEEPEEPEEEGPQLVGILTSLLPDVDSRLQQISNQVAFLANTLSDFMTVTTDQMSELREDLNAVNMKLMSNLTDLDMELRDLVNSTSGSTELEFQICANSAWQATCIIAGLLAPVTVTSQQEKDLGMEMGLNSLFAPMLAEANTYTILSTCQASIPESSGDDVGDCMAYLRELACHIAIASSDIGSFVDGSEFYNNVLSAISCSSFPVGNTSERTHKFLPDLNPTSTPAPF